MLNPADFTEELTLARTLADLDDRYRHGVITRTQYMRARRRHEAHADRINMTVKPALPATR